MVHLTIGQSIELIWSPFEVLPFRLDPVNRLIKVGFFELTGRRYPLRGKLMMKFISFPVIAIGSSNQIFPPWYLLTKNLEASSFKLLKLSTMGALR